MVSRNGQSWSVVNRGQWSVEVVSRSQYAAADCPVVVAADCDKVSKTVPQLTPEVTFNVRATPNSLEDKQLSALTLTVATVHVNGEETTFL